MWLSGLVFSDARLLWGPVYSLVMGDLSVVLKKGLYFFIMVVSRWRRSSVLGDLIRRIGEIDHVCSGRVVVS